MALTIPARIVIGILDVGGVTFLTIYSLVDASTFFLIIAASSVIRFASSLFLEEPNGHMAEVFPDGSVELIEVA